jgi:hypothetical protein
VVPDWVAERVRADTWETVGGGYTRAGKWLATLPDGTTVFVKATDVEPAMPMASAEITVYEHVSGSFMPQVVDAWQMQGRAVLVLEDLSRAHWPPPYPDDTRPVFDALARVSHTPPPPGLRRLEGRSEPPWHVLRDLDVCSADWLDIALAPLAEAGRAFKVTGDELVHYDVWSDNLCFSERGVLLTDWSAAAVGNGYIDVGYALLSILVEGGTPPTLEIPDEASLAAFVAGSVMREASAPLPAWAEPGSTLREDQRADLVHALRWAARALGLPPP